MRQRLLFLLLCFSANALAQPTANFTANITQGCAPLLVQFTNTSTGTNGSTTYLWNFNNGTASSVLPNPSTTFTLPGTYTIVLTATGPGGSNTKTQTAYITVHPSPTVAFSANDTDGCPPHAVQFTNTSNSNATGTTTYLWNFGDGTNSGAQAPGHTYNTPGSFNTTLQVTNSFGCSASLTKPGHITVYQPPVASFTATLPTACNAPGTTTFNPTVAGVGPFTYLWNFGDGSPNSTQSNPVKTYPIAGSYTVTLVVTDSRGCKDTVVIPAYINVGTLTASFTTNPTSVCEDAPVTFSNTSGPGATSAYWEFGNGQNANGQNPTIIYSAPGTYTVQLVVVQGTCADTIQQTFVVHPKPTIDFTATPQDPCPIPATVQFTNLTTNGATYTWLFGDGSTSTAANPSHTYTVYPNNYNNPPGNQAIWDTVTLIAVSSFGCTDTVRRPDFIRLRNIEAALEAAPAAYGCVPFTTTLSAPGLVWTQPLAAMPGAYPFPIVSWLWNFGDGSPTSTNPTPTHTYVNPGTYNATLTYTTANGCTETDTIRIRTGTIPTPSFTVQPTPTCVNEPVNFTSTSTGVNAQTLYTWSFGDGGSGGGSFTIHPYTTSGTYTVSLTVDNNGCMRSDTQVNVVTIHPPSAGFSTQWDCDTPLLVHFVNQSQNPTSFLWVFGDGATSTTDYNPTHVYPALGTYNVKLVTYNSTYGCKDSLTIVLDLFNSLPNWTTADTAICTGDTAVFTGSYPGGQVNQWKWHTGIGPLTGPTATWVTDTTPPIHQQVYLDTGRYTVRLAVEDAHGCWDTLVKENHIIVGRPSVGFSALPRLGCAPLLSTLVDTSHHVSGAFGVTRTWTTTGPAANINTVTTPSAAQTFPLAGLYTVKLKVTDNIGCTDSLVKLSYVDVRHPEAGFFASDTTACIGQSIMFNNASGGIGPLTYSWSFGDGGSSTAAVPTHAYTAVGNYTVRLIATDTVGCKDTVIKTAHISVTKPDAAFTVSDTMAICPPLAAAVTSTSTGAVSWAWNFGNGGSSILPNASNLYTVPGIYTIQLVVSDVQGCTDTALQTVRVLGYAGALTYSPLAGCEPLTVSFTANVANVPSIVWDFSDGFTQTATGPTTTHTYMTPGAYVPKLILSDGTVCQASSLGLDTIKVDGVIPGFSTGPVCAGTPVTFTDTSKGVFSSITTAQWTFNGTTATGHTATATYATPGTYPVTLIATNAAGCKDTLVRSVTINALPTVNAGADTSICINSSVQLGASGATSYVWSPAATLNNPAVAAPMATPTVPTTYTVVGTDANGCTNKDSVRISLQFKTTATAAAGDSACFGTPLQLFASGAEQYQWVPPTGLDNPTSASPFATPEQTSTYLVISRESTCIPDSDRVTVVVWPKPQVSAGADVQIISGGSTRLVATGPDIDQFLWTPGETLSCTACPDPQASPLKTTEYIVYVVNDYNCRDTDAVIVNVLCDESQVFVPNSFSPNADGQNDRFFPHGRGLESVLSFRVYNRWGELVFDRKNFQPSDESQGWDGTHRGTPLSPDVFVYFLEAVCSGGETLMVKGDVTLVR